MYTIERLSAYRRLENNILSLSAGVFYPIYMNIEVDVEGLLTLKKRDGYLMNALIAKAAADTIAADAALRPLNSVLLRNGLRNKLLVFDTVSFSIAQARPAYGDNVTAIYVLRDADRKTLREIDEELKTIAEAPLHALPVYRALGFMLRLPSVLQRAIMRTASWCSPDSYAAYGSLGLSNLGQSSISAFFPMTNKTAILGLGGTRPRVVLENDRPVEHRFMTVNLTFNHYVVDGKLCMQFLEALRQRLERLDFGIVPR